MVKLGGSLLDLEDLVDRLLAAVADVAAPLIVVGGGCAADLVRSWQERDLITPREAHRLAIAAMSFNAQQLAASDNRLVFAKSWVDVAAVLADRRIPLLDVIQALQIEQERHPNRASIPESWDATSDSIAAWLAQAWDAPLRLLKSVSPGRNPHDHVDAWFGLASDGLDQLTWTNLRASPAETFVVPVPLVERYD